MHGNARRAAWREDRQPSRALEKKLDTEGFEPSTSRMRNGRSSTELSALWLRADTRAAAAAVPKGSAGKAELNRCGSPRLQV